MSAAPELYRIREFQVIVENSRPDVATADVLSRLDEALALIERTQPWRLAHLRRDLARFWIVRYPCRGAFFPESRTCMTELTFLARRDITAAPVAASILHEGMHARVHARGLGGVDLPREERELGHAGARFREERAAARIAHDPESRQIAPQVREPPGLRALDEGERFVEPREHVGRGDVRARILDDHLEFADAVQLGRGAHGVQYRGRAIPVQRRWRRLTASPSSTIAGKA